MKKITVMISLLLSAALLFACKDDKKTSDEAKVQTKDEASWCMRGNVADYSYNSEWAGVSFVIPADMMVFDDEQTSMLMGNGGSFIEDSDGNKMFDISNMELVYDLCAMSEKNDMLFVTLHKNSTCTDYISKIKSDMNKSGVEITENSINLGGVDFETVEVVFATEYFTMYQTYLMKEVDSGLFCLSVGSEDASVIEAIKASVSAN